MKILLDTHIWIWNLAGAEELPVHFKEIIEDEENEIWLSPISVWETIVLGEKGKIKLKPEPTQWVRKALKINDTKEAPIDIEIAIKSRELILPHQDPADRLLAATSLVCGLQLATVDKVLLKAKWLPTLPL